MSGSWPCSDGVVTFDYGIWSAVYPNLVPSISEPAATIYWSQAELFLDNSAASPIQNLTTRAQILGMITAHIATLFGVVNGNSPSGLVGRIASASEGSVNVAVEMPGPMSAAWFNQTPYGAMAWMAMAPFRQALYVAAPQIPLSEQSYPLFFGGSNQWRR